MKARSYYFAKNESLTNANANQIVWFDLIYRNN